MTHRDTLTIVVIITIIIIIIIIIIMCDDASVVIIEEKVKVVETAGRNPEKVIKKLKDCVGLIDPYRGHMHPENHQSIENDRMPKLQI
eukprot:1808880-Amphidinium_carterae.1